MNQIVCRVVSHAINLTKLAKLFVMLKCSTVARRLKKMLDAYRVGNNRSVMEGSVKDNR